MPPAFIDYEDSSWVTVNFIFYCYCDQIPFYPHLPAYSHVTPPSVQPQLGHSPAACTSLSCTPTATEPLSSRQCWGAAGPGPESRFSSRQGHQRDKRALANNTTYYCRNILIRFSMKLRDEQILTLNHF